MNPYRLTERKTGRLFLKTANGILILCTLLVEPVLAQPGNPGRAEKSSEGRPDLSGIPANEAKAIENACNPTRQFRGPGEYYQCLQREITTLQSSGGRPDLSGIPANEVKAIENACNPTRQFRGPGEYYQCLQREITTLQRFLGPTKGLTTAEPKPEPAKRPSEKASDERGIQQTEEAIRQARPRADQRAEQKKLAPPKPEEKQREKSVDRKTTTGKDQTSPKEELGKETFADSDIASPSLPQVNHGAEPTKTPEPLSSGPGDLRFQLEAREPTVFDRLAAEEKPAPAAEKPPPPETLFPLVAFGFIILFFIGREIYSHIRRCIHCNIRTKNLNRICDPCKTRMDYEKAKAQERETQEREANIRAEQNKKRQEEARAQERRKRDEENARARERERQASEARKKAEENRRREEEQAQEERRRRQGARSNKQGLDPYQVLQITRGASKEEIKTAYLNLIKRYHPDKVSHLGKEFQEIADVKAKEINRAYEILTSS